MTLWDFLAKVMENTPLVVFAALFLLVTPVVIVFLVGFARSGMDFLKHGFGKYVSAFDAVLQNLATKDDIAGIRSELAGVHAEIAGVQAELAGVQTKIAGIEGELNTIKSNHFTHLKNFLTELTGILVDRNIISNENKARLDNHLRGM